MDFIAWVGKVMERARERSSRAHSNISRELVERLSVAYARGMCCFSGPVKRVEATRIFARSGGPGRQLLAYQMKLAAQAEVAMILPLPVPADTGEGAVRFISLQGYPELFEHIDNAFPKPQSFGPPGAVSGGILEVVKVGDFVASYVPSLADFARLDARFRVPPNTLDTIPGYASYGFAVFQLAVPLGALTEVHPMAFEFPTRHADHLFFPTVHVHDGALPATARFAHQLYAQGVAESRQWWPSMSKLGESVDAARAQGVIDPDAPARVRSMFGESPNTDQWVPLVS
jgi:hypothetical protein